MRIALLLLVLAGCPQKQAQPPVTPQAGAGCPRASGVYLAQYVKPPEGQQGYSGWAMPLHHEKVDSVEGKPAFAAIDPATASAAGVPTPPSTVWVLPATAPLCKATIGGYYAEAVDAPTKNMSYGVTLAGCPAPQDPNAAIAIAMVSDEAPSDCQPLPPNPVAGRVGEMKDGAWVRPAKETPMPDAFAKIVPDRACTAPDCEKLWSIARVDVGGAPVAWAGAVNWIDIPPGAPPSDACTWKVDTFSGFFVAGPDGSLAKVTEGQDHPLSLFVVLADRTGAKVLIAEGPGEYSTYDLAGGAATLGRHVVWLLDDPRAYGTSDHIGPECPPPG